MSKSVKDQATTIIKTGAKSQAVPAVLIGVAGVAVLGYLAGNKAENLIEGLAGSLGFGGAAEGAGAKSSDTTSTISDSIVTKYTETVTDITKSTGDKIINAGVSAAKTGAGVIVSTPSAVYKGASESLKIEPSTIQTSKTKAAITGRTEQGQAWSLTPASTEQLSKYVGTPGNVIDNWITQGTSQDLSGAGDTFSEYTTEEKARSTTNPTKTTILSRVSSLLSGDKSSAQKSYIQTGAASETKYNVVAGGGAGLAAMIKSYEQPAATTAKKDYGASTLGNLTAQVATLNTGTATKSSSSSSSSSKTYKESGQTKYKDASGKVHVKVK